LTLNDSKCVDLDDGKPIPGTIYTRGVIERIVRDQRLKLVKPDDLANIFGHGRLRLATAGALLPDALWQTARLCCMIRDMEVTSAVFAGNGDLAIRRTDICHAERCPSQLESESQRPCGATGQRDGPVGLSGSVVQGDRRRQLISTATHFCR
jgi:hypothetical protein